MAEIPVIDPDFEPQSRPRSCTWPMNRPNICSRNSESQDGDIAMKLEATIEECGSQEQLMADATEISHMVKQEPKQELCPTMSPSAFPSTDYSSVLMGSPASNLVSNILQTPLNVKTESTYTVTENVSQIPTFTSAPQSSHNAGNEGNKRTSLDIGSVSNTESPPATTVSVVTKAKTSSRKNAWGNMSYADLITQGIESSPDKRLTLAQIYDWMVKNVPYFKDKGDSNSSAGWKNSIRHNLSLHSKFKRIQNEGTGKSSWWVINYDAKPGKPARRRTTSMDTTLARNNKHRSKLAKQKVDQQKKEKSIKHDSSTWTKSPCADRTQDYEIPSKSFASEFRNRTSSNASSIGGRISPPHTGLLQDLEADGPPPLSPLSSSYTPSSNFTELFGQGPDAFSLVDSIDDPLHSDLLDSLAGIDMLNPSSPMTCGQSNVMTAANNDRTNIYLNTPTNNSNSQANSITTINKAVLSSPNLASLLQGTTTTTTIKSLTLNSMPLKQNVDLGGPVQRGRANTMPRLRPQPKYNMSESMQKPLQSAESLSQETLLTSFKTPETSLSASPHNVYNMGSYRQYPETHAQTPKLNMLGIDAPTRISSSANETTTLYQLLGSQPNNAMKSQQHLQHNGLGLQQNPQQPGNIPNQLQQPPQVIMDNQNLGMHEYASPFPKQSTMLGLGRADNPSQHHQHPIDDSNLMQMSQRKFPSDINIDNHEFFDPGPTLGLDQMLQDMDVPTEYPMDFGYPFQQDSVTGVMPGVDLDSTMETNSACNTNKQNESTEHTYQYNTGQLGLGNMANLQQGQHQYQQQTQHQAPPPQYNTQQHQMFQDINPYCGNNPNLLVDSHANGGVMMGTGGTSGSPGMGNNAFAQQFMQPHPNLRQQSSVGSIGHYRM